MSIESGLPAGFNPNAYDAIIVGAGFAGAVCARRLAEAVNYKVCVLDRRDHIAGNAYDYYDEAGILVHKYGPHIYQAAYTLLEEREHCSLTARLEALRSKQRQQGMSKTRAGRLTKMDAIAASPESVEHWLKILHEMEARYCTAAPEKE